MINWSKYFDKIICICYNKNQTRKQLLQFQLKRVGILDSGIFEWQITFQNKFINDFTNLVARSDMMTKHVNSGSLNILRISGILGHLNAVKRAYYEGCNRVLIIEDDIRFLKDLNQIQQLLQNIPNDNQWDMITFDKFVFNYINYFNTIKDKRNLVNKYYCKFDNLLSAACYCLNRNAMELITSVQDTGMFNITDFIFTYKNLKSYWKKIFSIKSLVVQVVFSNAATILNINKEKVEQFQNTYKTQQINFDDYMMRKDGSKYDYGDWIDI